MCGDTTSDMPMVIAVLRLMCGDKMVERWQQRLQRDDTTSEPQDKALRGLQFEPSRRGGGGSIERRGVRMLELRHVCLKQPF